VTLDDLDVDGLHAILRNPNSTVVLGKKRDFRAYDINIEFDDDALYRIAELAYQEHTGARGLVSVVDRMLIKFEKSLPDTQIREFRVTRQVVENPPVELEKMLRQYYIRNFQKRFLAANGIVITFTDGALNLLEKQARTLGINLEMVCSDLLREYEYGLKLLGAEQFTVDEAIARDPKARLEELIKKAYSKKA